VLKDFLLGAGYVLRGLRLIRRPGLRRFVVVPLLLNSALFALGIWWGYQLLDSEVIHRLPGWLAWARWLLVPLFVVTVSIIVFFTFSLLANLVGAPFNALLAERVERLLGGAPPDQGGGLWRLAGEALRSLWAELAKLLYLALWALPLLLLFLVPGLNVLAPFAWAAFSAWMLALEYADYPMGNHAIPFRRQRRILRRRRGLAWGFGGAILLLTSVPLVNFLVMPVAVAGATALWVERLRGEVERVS